MAHTSANIIIIVTFIIIRHFFNWQRPQDTFTFHMHASIVPSEVSLSNHFTFWLSRPSLSSILLISNFFEATISSDHYSSVLLTYIFEASIFSPTLLTANFIWLHFTLWLHPPSLFSILLASHHHHHLQILTYHRHRPTEQTNHSPPGSGQYSDWSSHQSSARGWPRRRRSTCPSCCGRAPASRRPFWSSPQTARAVRWTMMLMVLWQAAREAAGWSAEDVAWW